jgi:hypothetical protein
VSNAIDTTLDRTKLFKLQLEEAVARRYGGNERKPAMILPHDDAANTIEAPLLCADAIIERTNEATKELTYEVEKDGKVIFSTLSRPLAFAFMAGFNALPKAAKPEKDDAKPKSDASATAPPEAASVDAPSASSKPEASTTAQPRKRTVL